MNTPLDGYADKIAGEQGSGEWLRQRMGQCTASRFADVLDFTKAGKEGARRKAYKMECVIARLTGVAPEHFVTQAMQWGTDHEPMARMAYETATGALVESSKFVPHPTIKMCGGSPDGLIDDDGGLEIKCPNTGTHIRTILDGMSDDHLPQVQGYLWITGRQWFDFVSYDPRMPEGLCLHIQRIQRDEKYIAELSAAVIAFIAEVDEMCKRLLDIAESSAQHGNASPSGVDSTEHAAFDDPTDWRSGPLPALEL